MVAFEYAVLLSVKTFIKALREVERAIVGVLGHVRRLWSSTIRRTFQTKIDSQNGDRVAESKPGKKGRSEVEPRWF